MDDFYAILGVARDASGPVIRRAFRKRVLICHPDGGGSVDAFNELKTAYDVLSDPVRRRRYDETGQSGDPLSATPHQTKIIEILSIALDQALQNLNASRAFRQSDVLPVARECLAKMLSEAESRKKGFEVAFEQANTLTNRFRTSESANLMEIVVARRLLACRARIDDMSEYIRNIGEAANVLRNMDIEPFLPIAREPIRRTESVSPLLDTSLLARFR